MNNEPGEIPPAPPTLSAPPPLAPEPAIRPTPGPSSARKFIAAALSVFLVLVVIGGVLSVLDDSVALLAGIHPILYLTGTVSLLALLASVVIYGLMAITPIIPKRFFVPALLIIFGPLLFTLPLLVYFYNRNILLDWWMSWFTIIAFLILLRCIQGTWRFRWPLVPVNSLGARAFTWSNLVLFILVNLFVVLPLVLADIAGSAGFAISHFTDGFVSLRPSGIILQARKYVRDDGRSVVLFPMSHVAESDFYRSVAGSVSSNSVVLLEGVTDTQNLLTNKLSYRRTAKALHLAEQHDDLHLTRGKLVRADVDVQDFSTNTIAVLNFVALIHSRGLDAETISKLLEFSPSADVQQQLFDDLLVKRNQHVLQEFFDRLPQSDSFIIPWGAAHMSGLAQEIQKAGFHLVGTHNYVSVRFGSSKGKSADPGGWTPVPNSVAKESGAKEKS